MTAPLPPLRSAEIIAVGTEMLGPTKLDTNSLFLSRRLGDLGISLRAKSIVGDRRDDLERFFKEALERVDLVILTGGLGPTDDDLTREVVAKALGLELEQDPALVAGLEERFKRRGLRMPAINLRQAMVPRGARVLDNPNGSAPGLLLEIRAKIVVLLPGPPREMQPMFEAVIASVLQARAGQERFFRTVIFVAGRSESHVEEAIEPIYAPLAFETPPIETTILAAPGQIEVHLSALSSDPAAATAALDSARDRIVGALGDAVFSVNGEPLERVTGAMLQAAGWTIAAAESCTGGLLLSRLTDVPGSSAYVLGGVVAYGNEMKTAFAGVPADLIAANGAVSEPVAEAMASGIRSRTGATIGVGITGIAGPGGGTELKPVGTVAIAVAGPDGVDVRTMHYTGNRALIKHSSSQTALDMVRRAISRHAALRRD